MSGTAGGVVRRNAFGYVAAVVLPVAITLVVTAFGLPAFLFEHVATLLIVGIAVPAGLGPAVLAAVACVTADNILLRAPLGRPTAISGFRDIVDLALFVAVALVISALVRRAHADRAAAEAAAARERTAREQRDRLIAAVTHDLATPLSVLSAAVQFARQHGVRNDSDLQRLLGRLETAAARATSLVKTLGDARAIEAHDFTIDRRPVVLARLVADSAQMMDRLSQRHPIVLAIDDASVTVDGDAERLQRVVENLLTNAIKYSPEGGAVEVTVGRDGDHAVLQVRDHGIGVPPDAQPHVFDRAYRAPDAARYAPGLGLGLNMAAEIVRRHDGSIHVATAEGGGALFTIRLPLAAG